METRSIIYTEGITEQLLHKLYHSAHITLRNFCDMERVKIFAPEYFIGMHIDYLRKFYREPETVEIKKGLQYRGITVVPGYEDKLVIAHEYCTRLKRKDLIFELQLNFDKGQLIEELPFQCPDCRGNGKDRGFEQTRSTSIEPYPGACKSCGGTGKLTNGNKI
ncbi:MAG: hypothetical protein A3F72_03030 [Bacteroidetes bacterium RIFCSPLOWO2_12_FULL_35_15]|nr:MAG: hypothetical protein A3F72_03030 [Bacteroidetes bacterium RIFCSPLOWO2_12_FULL_35_15]